MYALYLGSFPLRSTAYPRGRTGHVAHPSRSIQFILVLFSFVYAAAVTHVLSTAGEISCAIESVYITLSLPCG
jgi:hypothetical protein